MSTNASKSRGSKRIRDAAKDAKAAAKALQEDIKAAAAKAKEPEKKPAKTDERAEKTTAGDPMDEEDDGSPANKRRKVRIADDETDEWAEFEDDPNGSVGAPDDSAAGDVDADTKTAPSTPKPVEKKRDTGKDTTSKPVASEQKKEVKQREEKKKDNAKREETVKKPANGNGGLSAMEISPTKPKVPEWACTACTYLNPAPTDVCKACQTPRKAKKGQASTGSGETKQDSVDLTGDDGDEKKGSAGVPGEGKETKASSAATPVTPPKKTVPNKVTPPRPSKPAPKPSATVSQSMSDDVELEASSASMATGGSATAAVGSAGTTPDDDELSMVGSEAGRPQLCIATAIAQGIILNFKKRAGARFRIVKVPHTYAGPFCATLGCNNPLKKIKEGNNFVCNGRGKHKHADFKFKFAMYGCHLLDLHCPQQTIYENTSVMPCLAKKFFGDKCRAVGLANLITTTSQALATMHKAVLNAEITAAVTAWVPSETGDVHLTLYDEAEATPTLFP